MVNEFREKNTNQKSQTVSNFDPYYLYDLPHWSEGLILLLLRWIFFLVIAKVSILGVVALGHHFAKLCSRGGYDYFLLLLGKSSIWFIEQHIFKIIMHFFLYNKICRILCHLIWGIWWFHMSKDFEAIFHG
jgi:hypothetical protein